MPLIVAVNNVSDNKSLPIFSKALYLIKPILYRIALNIADRRLLSQHCLKTLSQHREFPITLYR